jgi:transcriptional regulator with XRE-family HTH domain
MTADTVVDGDGMAAHPDMKELAAYLRSLREARNLSQRGLAELADVDHTRVSRLESGRHPQLRSDSRDVIGRLDQALRAEGRLVELAGFKDREDVRVMRRRPPFVDLVLSERTLDKRGKSAVIALYEAMRLPDPPSDSAGGSSRSASG